MGERGSDAPARSIWTDPAAAAAPRRRLTREQIVRAAIAVADRAGSSALTMAAVARELGSYTAMALYRHVPGKDALIDLMLDEVTGEVGLAGMPSDDWRRDLHAIARSSWEMVMRHAWYAQLVHAQPPLGPNMLRRTERVLEILTRRGATVAEAMTYAALLDRHVFGGALQAAEERDMQARHGLTGGEELRAAIAAAGERLADAGDHPILAGWMAAPIVVTPDEQFELSLTFLLDGIASRLPPRGDAA